MPQLVHPSFLRLGRRPAVALLLFCAMGLLVTCLARPTDATDPYVAGGEVTRVDRLSGALAAAAADRAAVHERLLGMTPAARRTVDRVVDRRAHRTYDEVTDLDAGGRPVAVFRYALDGRLQAATRLGWRPGAGPTIGAAPEAVRAGDAVARSLGVVPAGRPVAERRGTTGWSIRWDRLVAGIPVPGDGLRVQLWPDGSFHGLADAEHPLADRPSTTIPAATAEAMTAALLDGWIPARDRPGARIVGSTLAWMAPNDTFEPARPDAPAEVRRLAWVVSVRTSGPLAGALRGVEVSIDAGDGSLLGGDVLR
jgi:hypothetical protein